MEPNEEHNSETSIPRCVSKMTLNSLNNLPVLDEVSSTEGNDDIVFSVGVDQNK